MVEPVSINKKLNLVIPVDTDTGRIWVHSVPISREIFESNYLLLTRTLSNLYANGIGPAMAPRVSKLVFMDTAKEMDEKTDISSSLLQEIYRLTNFLMPGTGGHGWQTIPFGEVKAKKLIDEQQISEVENAVVYFIVASALHLKNELPMAYQGLKSIWNAETTFSSVTQYGNSLTTSTPIDNTGEKAPIVQKIHPAPRASSIPS